MVIEAAETIVVNDGESGLTVRRIARTIGHTVASIYMVFENMSELAEHLKTRTLDELTKELSSLPDSTPAKQIAEQSKAYLRFAAKNFNRWRMLLCDQNIASPGWYQDRTGLILDLVEAQFALLKPGLPAELNRQAAQALWSGVHGICILSLNDKCDEQALDAAEHAVALLVENFVGGWQSNGSSYSGDVSRAC